MTLLNMGLCCYLGSLELFVFYLGLFFLLRWFWRFANLFQQLKWGTKVTPDRYGPKGSSWAVITGSTDGIGKAIALELASRGFNIALVSRNADKLNNTAKEIKDKYKGVQTRQIAFDFT